MIMKRMQLALSAVALLQMSFMAQFYQASRTKNGAWLTLLALKDVSFGRTDPYVDPKGQNIVFSLMLAEKYYNMPDMADKILGSLQNPQQTHQEGGLLECLESGRVDAAAGYESEVRSDHLPYVALPDEINLRNPSMAKRWYDTVSFTIKDSKGQDRLLHTQQRKRCLWNMLKKMAHDTPHILIHLQSQLFHLLALQSKYF